ncbi:MAG TPA: methyltransferase domain-containing protein [Vicinamibacterales bacterium]|nr:methyltransferase domain-containing protein [Vicinamibacterales bacterium]
MAARPGRIGLVATLAGLFAIAAPAAQVVRDRQDAHRLHRDPKAYIAALEDPERDAYQKPHEVIAALELKEGESIADIGAGSGYFALRFAQRVGARGRVYAVDISPDMILHLNRRIRDLGLANVVSILAPPDDPLLRPASVDRIFFCNVWHHIEDRPAYLEVLKRALKPGGQLVIIDFHKRELPVGPPPAMKLARDEVLREVGGAGFRLVGEHTFLPYQYFLVFSLPSSASEPPREARPGEAVSVGSSGGSSARGGAGAP